MKLNLIDRVIGYWSPGTAVDRMAARMRIELGYDGAARDRRYGRRESSGTSANTETMEALPDLRDRSREMYRNSGYLRRGIKDMTGRIVGTGIMPSSKAKNDRDRAALDENFRAFAKQIGWQLKQWLAVKTLLESGEVLFRIRQRLPSDGLIVPMNIQLMEPDHIDHNKNGPSKNGNGYIVQGVEFSAIDEVVGYWLHPSHPGEVFLGQPGRGNQSRFVAAEDVSYMALPERVGQARGTPLASPVMTDLMALRDWQNAVQMKKKIEACLAAFVTGAPEGARLGLPQTTLPDSRRERFEPGMIEYLPAGSTVTAVNPSSSGSEPEYVKNLIRGVAAGLGVPYSIISEDFGDSNYSSSRLGYQAYMTDIENMQYGVVIPFFSRAWARFVDLCAIAGIIGKPDYSVDWIAPKPDMLDREAEAKADLLEMRIGTTTWGQAVARRGWDPVQQLDELAKWNQEFDNRKVIVDSDPRNRSAQGQEVGNGSDKKVRPGK